MLSSWRFSASPGGAEKEAAPRRAALRGGLRLATRKVVVYAVDPVVRSTRRDRTCVRVLLWIEFRRHHHEPGLDGDWHFARVDVHAGEEREDA
jgi:hypothetical protein